MTSLPSSHVSSSLSTHCPRQHGQAQQGAGGRAVFLDRDGVLIEDTGYPSDPDAIALLPGVAQALAALSGAGWRLVITTNQAGIARGKLTEARLHEIHDRLRDLLREQGVELDAIYYCPHHAEYPVEPYNVACDHRKPGPGMLLSAAELLRVELPASWMIGDRESDVRAGHAAGCRAILIGSGPTEADATAGDLPEAAAIILRDQTQSAA